MKRNFTKYPVLASKQPKWWNSSFATKVIDAYRSGELTLKNIDKWEQEYADKYNNGSNPGNFGTKQILEYHIKTGKDPRDVKSSVEAAYAKNDSPVVAWYRENVHRVDQLLRSKNWDVISRIRRGTDLIQFVVSQFSYDGDALKLEEVKNLLESAGMQVQDVRQFGQAWYIDTVPYGVERVSSIEASSGSFVGEPSAAEYGEALSEGYRKMQEKYAPFRVSDVYFNSWTTNPSGYRITLKGDSINTAGELEWIAHRDGSSFNKLYKLYGPFYPDEIQSLQELFTTQPLDETFRSLNSVMTYLFEEYDIEG